MPRRGRSRDQPGRLHTQFSLPWGPVSGAGAGCWVRYGRGWTGDGQPTAVVAKVGTAPAGHAGTALVSRDDYPTLWTLLPLLLSGEPHQPPLQLGGAVVGRAGTGMGLAAAPHACLGPAPGAGAGGAGPRGQGHEGGALRNPAVELVLGLVFLEQALVPGKGAVAGVLPDQVEPEWAFPTAPDRVEGGVLEAELDIASDALGNVASACPDRRKQWRRTGGRGRDAPLRSGGGRRAAGGAGRARRSRRRTGWRGPWERTGRTDGYEYGPEARRRAGSLDGSLRVRRAL